MKKKIKVIASVEMDVWVTEDVVGNQEIEEIEDITEIIEWEQK